MPLITICINLKHLKRFRSEIGHIYSNRLEKEGLLPVVVMYRKSPEFQHKFDISFRSFSDVINCAEICSLYKGGGHFKAAGMTITKSDFKKLMIVGEMSFKSLFQKWNEIKEIADNLDFNSDIMNMRFLASSFISSKSADCEFPEFRKIVVKAKEANPFEWHVK